MAKIPQKPEEIFPEITGDYRNVFGDDLISIILYGSGAGDDYVPGKSDLNFLIVLTERGIDGLDRILETVGKWRKRNVAIPLFMTRDYLAGALDAYPIEFLNMKRSYRVVTGYDLLAEIAFEPCNIRLQLERELRGKLLHLRSGYLATEGKEKKVRELIGASLTAFVSLFGAMLNLKHLEVPKKKADLITAAGAAFGFDAAVFLKCEEIKREKNHFSPAEVSAIFRDYLKEVNHLCEIIDRMETK
jgi:predicted nucleotidyltransferase